MDVKDAFKELSEDKYNNFVQNYGLLRSRLQFLLLDLNRHIDHVGNVSWWMEGQEVALPPMSLARHVFMTLVEYEEAYSLARKYFTDKLLPVVEPDKQLYIDLSNKYRLFCNQLLTQYPLPDETKVE